jgi:hypothetical protein
VHRDQIELVRAVFLERLLDLFDSFFTPDVAQAHFGGEKQRVAHFELVDELPDHGFRRAVRRRAVDHLAAQRLKLPDRFAQRRFLRVVLNFFVAARRADSYDGNAFPRRRNLFLDEGLGLRENVHRTKQQRSA